MAESKKVLLVCSEHSPAPAGTAIELSRLGDALRARGAEVEEQALACGPGRILEDLAAGTLVVVFRGERR